MTIMSQIELKLRKKKHLNSLQNINNQHQVQVHLTTEINHQTINKHDMKICWIQGENEINKVIRGMDCVRIVVSFECHFKGDEIKMRENY